MPECPPSLHAEWYSSSMSSSCTPSCVDSVLARRCAGPGRAVRGSWRARRAGAEGRRRTGRGRGAVRCKGPVMAPGARPAVVCVLVCRRYDPRATRRRDADTRTILSTMPTTEHSRTRGPPRAIIASPRRTPPQSHMIASRTAQPLQFCCSRVRAYEPSIYPHRPSTSD